MFIVIIIGGVENDDPKIITLAVDEGGVMDDTLEVWNGPVNCVIVVVACEVGAPFTAL